MLIGFRTENEVKAQAAFLVYAIYRSRDVKKGPSGIDMWSQIERFVRSAAKRATNISEFTQAFKRKMACGTINPKYTQVNGKMANASFNRETGEIMVFDEARDFGIDVFEQPEDKQKQVVDCLYNNTQVVILLVRDRLEREKDIKEEDE